MGVRIDPIDPQDWHIEGVTGIEGIITNPAGDWRKYESAGEWQKDMIADFETDACVSFSANDTLQIYGNFMIATGAWSQQTIGWLRSKGYLDAQDKLHFSDRFTAMMSGTTQAGGNSLPAVGNAIRKYGLVPDSLWPMPTDEINGNPANAWDIYYVQPPANVLALGIESLKYLQINYQWLVSSGNGAKSSQFAEWLQTAPIQIATAVCPPWNTTDIIQGCGTGAAHATQLSYVDNVAQTYHILDHYVPFDKELAFNYTLAYAMQYTLSSVSQPVQAPTPVNIDPIVLQPVAPITNPTPVQIALLQKLLNALQSLAAALGIRPSTQAVKGIQFDYMNTYNPFLSKTNITLAIIIVITVAQAVVPFMPVAYQAILTAFLGALATYFHTSTAIKAGAIN